VRMAQTSGPADLARSIGDARERLVGFVQRCTDQHWRSAPMPGDPRPVGVICDHVAHAYEYLGGWIGDLIAGRPAEVSSDLVDALNAEHAVSAAAVTQANVTGHLRASGDAIVDLVAGLDAEQLELDGGRVRRFAVIAIRHADDHRAQLEEALATADPEPTAAPR
jgi:hypothetical protein